MFRRLAHALRYAVREEGFLSVVEVLRRLGFAFVTVQEEEKKAKES
jgi:hypothetical protein